MSKKVLLIILALFALDGALIKSAPRGGRRGGGRGRSAQMGRSGRGRQGGLVGHTSHMARGTARMGRNAAFGGARSRGSSQRRAAGHQQRRNEQRNLNPHHDWHNNRGNLRDEGWRGNYGRYGVYGVPLTAAALGGAALVGSEAYAGEPGYSAAPVYNTEYSNYASAEPVEEISDESGEYIPDYEESSDEYEDENRRYPEDDADVIVQEI